MNLLNCYTLQKEQAIPIVPLTPSSYPSWCQQQSITVQNWLMANHFTAKANTFCLIPDENGGLQQVVCGYEKPEEFWALAYLANVVPAGRYFFAEGLESKLYQNAMISWGLASYHYNRYKKMDVVKKGLVLPAEFAALINNTVEAIYLTRDLINTPSEDMGPAQLAEAAEKLSKQYQANFQQIVGEELLQDNFPIIHLVGRASDRSPRLIDFQWGNPKHPRVTLVGKGVCFDSGGLDLKPCSGMRIMKKDMGGAAHVLGLAQLIMAQNLPIRLRVLIPAVDNMIAGNAYKPGDVVVSRKGLSVEIDNTDAEGRLVLADALALASEEKPDLIIDFSTLTGAARVALGTDLPAMFSNDESVATNLLQIARETLDPMWQMPLYAPYQDLFKSSIADMANSSASPYAGAITAALFLQRFVGGSIPWVHFDLMAWNLCSRPGRPEGGEALAIRAVFSYLHKISFN